MHFFFLMFVYELSQATSKLWQIFFCKEFLNMRGILILKILIYITIIINHTINYLLIFMISVGIH